MGGHGFYGQGPTTASLGASGTIYFNRPVGQTPYQSVQITCLGTGSTSGLLQVETTNVTKNVTSDQATDKSWYWCPEASGTIPAFTGSGQPASQMLHLGNLDSRFIRLRADLGPGLWEIYWHGKA